MKAISLWQPYASLIAVGAKPYETRSYPPPKKLIGQRIAIHAAKTIDKAAAAFTEDLVYGWGRHRVVGREKDGHASEQTLAQRLELSLAGVPDGLLGTFGSAVLPIGCVVATAKLAAAFHLGPRARGTAVPAASTTRRMSSVPLPGCFTVRYDEFGDYTEGRWAWLLADVRPLFPPVAMKGRQGFFNLPQGWLDSERAAALT